MVKAAFGEIDQLDQTWFNADSIDRKTRKRDTLSEEITKTIYILRENNKHSTVAPGMKEAVDDEITKIKEAKKIIKAKKKTFNATEEKQLLTYALALRFGLEGYDTDLEGYYRGGPNDSDGYLKVVNLLIEGTRGQSFWGKYLLASFCEHAEASDIEKIFPRENFTRFSNEQKLEKIKGFAIRNYFEAASDPYYHVPSQMKCFEFLKNEAREGEEPRNTAVRYGVQAQYERLVGPESVERIYDLAQMSEVAEHLYEDISKFLPRDTIRGVGFANPMYGSSAAPAKGPRSGERKSSVGPKGPAAPSGARGTGTSSDSKRVVGFANSMYESPAASATGPRSGEGKSSVRTKEPAASSGARGTAYELASEDPRYDFASGAGGAETQYDFASGAGGAETQYDLASSGAREPAYELASAEETKYDFASGARGAATPRRTLNLPGAVEETADTDRRVTDVYTSVVSRAKRSPATASAPALPYRREQSKPTAADNEYDEFMSPASASARKDVQYETPVRRLVPSVPSPSEQLQQIGGGAVYESVVDDDENFSDGSNKSVQAISSTNQARPSTNQARPSTNQARPSTNTGANSRRTTGETPREEEATPSATPRRAGKTGFLKKLFSFGKKKDKDDEVTR